MSGARALHAAVWELYLRVVRLEMYRRATPRADFGHLKDKLDEICESLGRAEVALEESFSVVATEGGDTTVSAAEIRMLEQQDGVESVKGSDVMHPPRPPMQQCLMSSNEGGIMFDQRCDAELWIREMSCIVGAEEWRTIGLWVIRRPTFDTVELCPLEVERITSGESKAKWEEYRMKARVPLKW